MHCGKTIIDFEEENQKQRGGEEIESHSITVLEIYLAAPLRRDNSTSYSDKWKKIMSILIFVKQGEHL